MELTNDFVVPIGIEAAWALLTDVERIAPCMPGAQLQEIDGDEYRGVVKVKVGPITAQYKGTATFVKKDDGAHVAVLNASGRDTKGQGNAQATITATLVEEGAGTRVTVLTDLAITGRVAQFGRGVMADVSSKLLGQFVSCLETTVLAEESGSGEEAEPEAGPAAVPSAPVETTPVESTPAVVPGARKVEHQAAAPVDLLEAAGSPVLKRLAPVLVVVLLALVLGRRRRRRT